MADSLMAHSQERCRLLCCSLQIDFCSASFPQCTLTEAVTLPRQTRGTQHSGLLSASGLTLQAPLHAAAGSAGSQPVPAALPGHPPAGPQRLQRPAAPVSAPAEAPARPQPNSWAREQSLCMTMAILSHPLLYFLQLIRGGLVCVATVAAAVCTCMAPCTSQLW